MTSSVSIHLFWFEKCLYVPDSADGCVCALLTITARPVIYITIKEQC